MLYGFFAMECLFFLNGSKHNLANDDDDLSWLLWFNFLHLR